MRRTLAVIVLSGALATGCTGDDPTVEEDSGRQTSTRRSTAVGEIQAPADPLEYAWVSIAVDPVEAL